MPKDAKTVIFKCVMGKGAGVLNFAFRAAEDAYPSNVRKDMGITVAKDTENNLAFGCNVKPARVWVNLANGKSLKRFCDPGKMESLVVDGAINGKKWNGANINSVRPVQG